MLTRPDSYEIGSVTNMPIMQTGNNVHAFITELRGLSVEKQARKILQERKKIAFKEFSENELSTSGALKKLFFQLRGAQIDELEFVKMCASSIDCVKQCGYLGLLFLERTKHNVLMTNTLAKDMKSRRSVQTALTFLCNNYDAAETSTDVYNQLVLPADGGANFNKLVIAQSKIHKSLFFALCPSSDNALLTKIQIILDHGWEGEVTENDVNYLNDRILSSENKILTLKLLQILAALYRGGKLDLGAKLLEYLKNLVIGPSSKAKKYIDIAVSLESCKLLCITRNFFERAERFLHRLITSENPNSRFLGFSFSSEHGIFTEVVCDRIIGLGSYNKFYLETLKSLVNESNYKKIYRQKEELIRNIRKDVIDVAHERKILMSLLVRIATFANFEFLCKMLYETPALYSEIRTDQRIIVEQSRPLFKSIISKDNPEYFQLLYDIIPARLPMAQSLISKHLKILLYHPLTSQKLNLIPSLVDLMLENGDLEENRRLLFKEFFNPEFSDEPRLRDILLDGDNNFIQYSTEQNCLNITCDVHISSVVVAACDSSKTIPLVISDGNKKVFSVPEDVEKLLISADICGKEVLKEITMEK